MKVLLKNIFFGSRAAQGVNQTLVKAIRILLVTAALGGIIGLMPDIASKAQRPNSQNSLQITSDASASASSENETSSGLFLALSISGLVGLGLTGLLVVRRRRAGWQSEFVDDEEMEFQENELTKKVGRKSDSPRPAAPSLSLIKPNSVGVGAQPTSSYSEGALFGSYRVDQEIGKLILGEPHRMDVLASRAPEDRRAMEVALIKALTSPNTSEEGRQRARQALEEYGFVARQSATLLAGR